MLWKGSSGDAEMKRDQQQRQRREEHRSAGGHSTSLCSRTFSIGSVGWLSDRSAEEFSSTSTGIVFKKPKIPAHQSKLAEILFRFRCVCRESARLSSVQLSSYESVLSKLLWRRWLRCSGLHSSFPSVIMGQLLFGCISRNSVAFPFVSLLEGGCPSFLLLAVNSLLSLRIVMSSEVIVLQSDYVVTTRTQTLYQVLFSVKRRSTDSTLEISFAMGQLVFSQVFLVLYGAVRPEAASRFRWTNLEDSSTLRTVEVILIQVLLLMFLQQRFGLSTANKETVEAIQSDELEGIGTCHEVQVANLAMVAMRKIPFSFPSMRGLRRSSSLVCFCRRLDLRHDTTRALFIYTQNW
jgi:hypothetical protein